jgi:hypothetical protein
VQGYVLSSFSLFVIQGFFSHLWEVESGGEKTAPDPLLQLKLSFWVLAVERDLIWSFLSKAFQRIFRVRGI